MFLVFCPAILWASDSASVSSGAGGNPQAQTSAGGAPPPGSVDLGTVSSGASAGAEAIPPAETATAVAPTQGSLTATEPQSVISRQYIENTQRGASDYLDIAGIAPGVWAYSPNGPGGNDNPGLSMRGFSDGQYNVTFDGIPFADGADFTHHVNTYFIGEDTGELVVDRGPGRASTIGDATFGGTIAMRSKDNLSDPTSTVRLQTGSYNSRLIGAEFDTGVMQNYGDTSAFVDYNHYQTDGALTNDGEQRSNLFAKMVRPVGNDTAITVVVMQNDTSQHASLGATAAQIAQYGSRFGLNTDPTSQAFVGNNQDHFTTWFGYVGVQTRMGDWKIDDKVYADSYAHNAINGLDPNGATPNGTVNGPSNIPGVTGLTAYTSFGNVMRATDAIGKDDLGMGVWLERQLHHSFNNLVDLSNGGEILASQGTEMSSMNSIQPYLEYTWRPTASWAVTPGVKYNYFTRSQASPLLVQGPGTTDSAYAKYSALLPSFDVHYYLNDHWSAYGQASEGFLPPLLSYLASANPSAIATQKTDNYQTGSVFKTSRVTLSGDIYYITNNNLIQAVGVSPGGLPLYQNAGKVDYRGVEGEVTYNLGRGINLYGNFSASSASSAVTTPVLNNPKNTAALGLLYNHGPANASLIAKEIGSRITGQDAFNNNVTLGSYTIANFVAGYNLGLIPGWAKASVELQVDDLFNRTGIIAQNGRTGTSALAGAPNGDPLFWTLPGRLFNLNLSVQF